MTIRTPQPTSKTGNKSPKKAKRGPFPVSPHHYENNIVTEKYPVLTPQNKGLKRCPPFGGTENKGLRRVEECKKRAKDPFYSSFFAFLARTLNQIGVPSNPNASRIWFSRNRSKLKCSWMSRSVNRMNVGGATAACVI